MRNSDPAPPKYWTITRNSGSSPWCALTRPRAAPRWTVRLVAEEAVKRKLIPQVGRETIRILLRHHRWSTRDRSGFQFAQVLFRLALQYPKAETIHLVMDNLSSHHQKSLTDLYGKEMASEVWNCFTVHYTPKHGSWLNQAEIEIGIFARQCLGKRRIPDLKSAGSSRLESADEPESGQDQLEVRSQSSPSQVRLHNELF